MTHIVWWGWPKIKQGEDHGVAMYKEFFPEGDFTYHYDIRTVPEGIGTVLVVNSCISEQTANAFGIVHPSLSAIQKCIDKMPWVIILLAQDEDAHTRLDTLVHPKMRLWVQCPKPIVTAAHPGLDWAYKLGSGVRSLPMGYDSDFNRLVSYKPSFETRSIDWMFKGQCAYHRHGDWLKTIQVLANHAQPIPDDVNSTFVKYEGRDAEYRQDGFYSIDDYIKLHTDSKVVICRPEGWNPCPARIFYVLQAGCIPIVSEKPSTRGAWYDFYDWNNWWEFMLGEKPPFPVVKNVSDLGYVLQQTLNEWPENGKRVYSWWIDYKARLGASLRAEIEAIQR